MLVYIWRYPVKAEWMFEKEALENEMKRHWIDSLLPVFTDIKKAKAFCWKDYITMARDK